MNNSIFITVKTMIYIQIKLNNKIIVKIWNFSMKILELD